MIGPAGSGLKGEGAIESNMRRIRHNRHENPGGRGPEGDPGGDSDWDLSEGLDPEGPSAQDLDRFGSEIDKCPHCGSAIYDQSEMCPQCGWYLGENPKTMSPWVMLGIFGLIVLFLLVMVWW